MVIPKYKYELRKLVNGYANRTLYINLTDNEIISKSLNQEIKDKFIGGRGFCLWLMWNSLPQDRIINWDDQENELCVASGPLGGIPIFPGSGKCKIMSLSPLVDSLIDNTAGGDFGAFLKLSGWDALEIQGKSDSDVIIYIDGDEGFVSVEENQSLPSETNLLGDLLTKKYSKLNYPQIAMILSGPGADHTRFGCLNFSWYDTQRKKLRYKQAGRGGWGTVFRDKGIKAIIVKQSKPINIKEFNPNDIDLIKTVGREFSKEIRDLDLMQKQMSLKGTSYLVSKMNEDKLLPVMNFKYGNHPETSKISGEIFKTKFDPGFDGCCRGCAMSCSHCIVNFELKTGPYKGNIVSIDGPEYETISQIGSNCGIFDPGYVAEMNYYCDNYALDTDSVGTAIAFVMECYERGIINKEHTGGLEIKFGNSEAALNLVHQMAKGEGFGDIIGQGIRRMKKLFAEKYQADPNMLKDIGMEWKGLEYSSRMNHQQNEFLQTKTLEEKKILHWVKMLRAWFGLCGLCRLPWNDVRPNGNQNSKEPSKVMKHVEYYLKLFSAVTGRSITSDELINMSERIHVFQKIFNLRLGYKYNAEEDFPYRSLGPLTVEEYNSRVNRYDKQLEKTVPNLSQKTTKEKIALLRKYNENTTIKKLKNVVYIEGDFTFFKDRIPTLEEAIELGLDSPEIIDFLRNTT